MREIIKWNNPKETLPITKNNVFDVLIVTKFGYTEKARYNHLTKYFQSMNFDEIKDVKLWCWLPTGNFDEIKEDLR